MAILEQDLIDRIRPIVADKYFLGEEIGLFNRSIDMLLFDRRNLLSIEFKIKDWKKAIRQIRDHQIAADYSYLCMPKRKVSSELQSSLEEYGIGLWLYDMTRNELAKEVEARKSSTQCSFYRNMLINRLLQKRLESNG